MASQISICNQALANIRAPSINAIDDASLEARYCLLKYDYCLEAVLADAPWHFARKQVALALTNKDPFNYTYAYQYPSDCLRINRVMSPVNRVTTTEPGYAYRPQYYENDPFFNHLSRVVHVPYEVMSVEGEQVITSNESDLWIDYQFLQDDPNHFTPQFTTAFVWYLASELAMPIIGGDAGRMAQKATIEIYQAALRTAIATNANTQDTGPPVESEYTLIKR